MTLSANSGNNDSSLNTGGNTTINRGDANVDANMLIFGNNNMDGKVTLGVGNSYGNLNGEIILPDVSNGPTTGTSSDATNTVNGASSTNNASNSSDANSNTAQNNGADITNDLVLNGTTGDNQTNGDTDGSSTVNTGATNVDSNTLNIANSNIDGGNWWLVIVNVAGQWIGELVGAPGSNMEGSPGTTFTVGADGQVTASNGVTNAGNGANSTNNASNTSSNNNTTTQNNDARIHNTLNWSANTGSNTTKYNTGGDSTINTGNANIIADLVNFVNNNITGGGHLYVTLVNVFGSWVGNFVGPGQTDPNKSNSNSGSNSPVAGASSTSSNSSNTHNNNNNANTNGSSNSGSNTTQTPGGVTTVTTNNTTTYSYYSSNHGYVNGNPQDLNNKVADAQGNILGASVLGAHYIKKTLIFNLAWLLLIVPLGVIGLIAKKMIVKRLAR